MILFKARLLNRLLMHSVCCVIALTQLKDIFDRLAKIITEFTFEFQRTGVTYVHSFRIRSITRLAFLYIICLLTQMVNFCGHVKIFILRSKKIVTSFYCKIENTKNILEYIKLPCKLFNGNMKLKLRATFLENCYYICRSF